MIARLARKAASPFIPLLLLGARHSRLLHAGLARTLPTTEFASYDRARWEQEYRAGGWDWLRGAAQAVHQHVIACQCRHLHPNPAILDVGCGEGALCELLRHAGYASYVGIDISATAAGRACARLGDARTRFVTADADRFASGERFDIIVLNETLYYFPDPPATMRGLARLLRTDGVFVVSMAVGGLRDRLLKIGIWRDLALTHETLDELTLTGRNGPMRTIKVLRPRGAARRPDLPAPEERT